MYVHSCTSPIMTKSYIKTQKVTCSRTPIGIVLAEMESPSNSLLNPRKKNLKSNI